VIPAGRQETETYALFGARPSPWKKQINSRLNFYFWNDSIFLVQFVFSHPTTWVGNEQGPRQVEVQGAECYARVGSRIFA
jgi:hypothetical protein